MEPLIAMGQKMTPWLFIVVMYIFMESNYNAIAKIVEET
jgi:hypothetical protein